MPEISSLLFSTNVDFIWSMVLDPKRHLGSQMLLWKRNFVSKTFGSQIWLTKLLETKFRFQNFCQRNFVCKRAYGCYNGVFQVFFTRKRPSSCPFWLYYIIRHAMLNFPHDLLVGCLTGKLLLPCMFHLLGSIISYFNFLSFLIV